MPIRRATLEAKVKQAKEQLDDGKTAAALRTLDGLTAKMAGEGRKAKRAPTEWSKYYGNNYKRMAKLHPNLKAPAIMKLLAKEYRERR